MMSENSLWSLRFYSTTVTVFAIAQFFLLLIVAVITLIVINYRRRIYIAVVTLPRDLRYVKVMITGIRLVSFTSLLMPPEMWYSHLPSNQS